jgi:micrococcal nuclease
MRTVLFCIALTFLANNAAGALERRQIAVVDGDTVRVDGRLTRLVGYDAPEVGERARCETEKRLGEAAIRRLTELVASSNLDFEFLTCSCRPNLRGTERCNRGRACGRLLVNGKDVSEVMIREGLAKPFICRRFSCPNRQPWC